nr:MAG TPA: hypothetical protein [Crassvirales sp.]DAL80313.1 MAG TPA: hypothetical protein [Caudoviricetes sp.]DAR45694.1 MAG TPA: hypothetical protein [Bacteriophage sp.]DAU06225.1 MAG TPA: hypothetical protein [Caudoviricetes sp.]DAX21816.1 MAG TPA: hypothetical protein [Caudoviricetes sp.]
MTSRISYLYYTNTRISTSHQHHKYRYYLRYCMRNLSI